MRWEADGLWAFKMRCACAPLNLIRSMLGCVCLSNIGLRTRISFRMRVRISFLAAHTHFINVCACAQFLVCTRASHFVLRTSHKIPSKFVTNIFM